MTYDFLNHFHKRMEIIAIIDFITTRVSRKTKLKEYGVDAGEAIHLIMLVLCFIMEKSLLEEICTKNDIAAFLRKMDVEYLKKNIADEQYVEIADILIKDSLQNNGLPHYFSTHRFETGKEERIHVKLIDDKRVSLDTGDLYSYYMTPQGYKFLFNTLEIEDAMQVSIEQFKLSLSIKKKNFSAAKNNVDNLYNITKTQIQRIHYFIKKIKEDIGSVGIEEYEKIYNDTFTSIDEQKEGYDHLYDLIRTAEDAILEGGGAKMEKDVLKKEIGNIAYIKNRLKFMMGEQSRLLLKQQELQKVYNEAIDNILYMGFDNRLNFEELVLKKLEDNPELSYPLISVLRPLLKPKLNQFFNLRMALKEQRIIGMETKHSESNVLMSERYFNQMESENEARVRGLNERYTGIFETICRHALESPNNEIHLSELMERAGKEYLRLVPDLKILTNVLIQLCGMKRVDFDAIKGQKTKTVFHPSEEFDVKYCVLALLEQGGAYQSVSTLDVLLSRNKQVFIPETNEGERQETEPDGFAASRVTGLNCPDVLFRMKVGGSRE